MKVNIKLIEDGKIPVKMHKTDAGFDCYARSVRFDTTKNQVVYDLGFAIEIPRGYVGLIFPRSSVCKQDLLLTNSVGVIDSDYRGEVSAVFFATKPSFKRYEVGDRVCQLIIMPYPKVELKAVDVLSETERGNGGYGSTGNK